MTTTTENVSEALKLVGEKKETLRQAFLELESHSSSLSSFSVTWSDLDHHFSSIESSLLSQFDDIKSRMSYNPPIASTAMTAPCARAESRSARGGSSGGDETLGLKVRLEMKALCEKMDGRGLRKYIDDHLKELAEIKKELSEALKYAEDPGLMVLDAMEGFYPVDVKSKQKGEKDIQVKDVRRTCVALLEELMNAVGKEGISWSAREKAKNLAWEWKGMLSRTGGHFLEALGFLTLVATYDLRNEFDADEITELFVDTARFRQAINLCRVLIMPDKIPDVVQKLIEADKQLLAVKFICEFALAEKFPPVPLLKAYVNDVKQNAKNVLNKGNHSRQAMNEAASKEINALRTVLRYVEDHKLESEYPPKVLERRIEEIKSYKNNKKRPAADVVNGTMQQRLKHQAKGQQPGDSRRFRNAAIAAPSEVQTQEAIIRSSMIGHQPAHLPSAASSTVTPYMTLNPDVSGFSGSNLNVARYPGNRDVASYSAFIPGVDSYGSSLAGLYSTAGAPVIHPAKPSPKSSYMYLPEAQLPSAYHSTATAYVGGFSVPPQYHPQYYPE
uniref:FRIGIDA-like protein n=1 Tax=Kalanchoe fedtschenkoi TaxID=63787 RepID=A0A7N0U263_KALFE